MGDGTDLAVDIMPPVNFLFDDPPRRGDALPSAFSY
jgi:hypothetical protein